MNRTARVGCWAALLLASTVAQAKDGDSDTQWGGVNHGRILLDVTTDGDHARALLIEGDGRLVSAGTCGATSFCATRQLPSGGYDAGFGPATRPGRAVASLIQSSLLFGGAALTADGGMILAGTSIARTHYGVLTKLELADADSSLANSGQLCARFLALSAAPITSQEPRWPTATS